MRLFDIPIYGSIVSTHEEILKEFIPESDFIVYVVYYRVGLGDDDFQFLKYVGEIINDNVEAVLAVNMCPKDVQDDNRRICEIKKSVNECIHKDVKAFFIESNSEKNPEKTKLWDYIYERVNDPNKKENILEKIDEVFTRIKVKSIKLIDKSDIKIKELITEYRNNQIRK